MKINPIATPAQGNIETAIDFSIDSESTAFIIQMLSSKLYEKPVMAMVRETITNAIDANNSNDRENTPIEIGLVESTGGVLLYSVADVGSGMSPDCVAGILTKLGKSTKSGDNKSHGGYGLGILSVFAVTTQAQIETISEGIKYSYLLFLNDKGIPALSLLSKTESAESGTKIIVPIPSKLVDEVKSAIEWFHRMVDPSPLLKIEPFEWLLTRKFYCDRHTAGAGWNLISIDNKPFPGGMPIDTEDLRVIVKIGQIPYTLEYELLREVNDSCGRGEDYDLLAKIVDCAINNHRVSQRAWGLYLIIELEIGAVDLPGSRENVLKTDRNVELIHTGLSVAVRELRSHLDRLMALNATSLEQKINLATSWALPVFEHKGVSYPTSGLCQKLSMAEVVDTSSYRSKIPRSKVRYLDRTYRHLLGESNDEVTHVIICARQHPLATIKRLLAKKEECTLEGAYLCIFDTVADYEAEKNKNPFSALFFANASVSIDPGVKVRDPDSSFLDRKYARQLRKLTEVGYISSLKEWGRFQVEKPLGEEECKLEFFATGWPCDDFYYLPADRLSTNLSAWAYARLCYRLDIDTELYILNNETICALRHTRPGTFHPIAEFVDPAALDFVTAHIDIPLRIGMFPCLSTLTDLRQTLGQHMFDRILDFDLKLIEAVIENLSVRLIADRQELILIENYKKDLDIWRILIHLGNYLQLTKAREAYRVPVKSAGIANLDDSSLSMTLPRLLQPVLKQLPLFKCLDFGDADFDFDALSITLNTLGKMI
jgi:Histidine kinase-, DNA gyrase B-, and HSP90-like ATPase